MVWRSQVKMRLNKLVVLLALALLGCSSQKGVPHSYESTRALLHLNANMQHDSIGYNVVSAMSELLYPKLLTGDLPLWSNSSKRAVVGSVEFNELEKKADRPFVRNNNLFIHEFWNIYKKNFDFRVQGFTFIGKSKEGETITYGYVDAPDIINLLKTEFIPTNVNGNSSVTYWDALHAKTYDFTLVQFGSNDFKGEAKMSALLEYQAMLDPSINREFKEHKIQKEITYHILSPLINSNPENKVVYSTIEKYINNNKQTILNKSTSNYFLSKIYDKWSLESITITEEWKKINGIPFQEFKSIELFIGKESVTLTRQELDEMNIRINLQGISEYVSEKNFTFLIKEVNDEEIEILEATDIYKALKTKPWNKIK